MWLFFVTVLRFSYWYNHGMVIVAEHNMTLIDAESAWPLSMLSSIVVAGSSVSGSVIS